MNNHTPLPPNPVASNIQTPWPRLAELNPVTFLSGLCAWPGWPSAALMRTAVTVADKKAMKAFLDRNDAAVKLRDENDVPGVLEQSAKIGRESNPHAQCEAERLRRVASTLDIDAYHRACGEIAAVEREARAWGADWCERAAEKLWRVFDQEAEQVEARIIRLGGAMVETRIIDGVSQDFWTPHGDPLLAALYYAIWSLNFYMPANFRQPALYTNGPLGTFADLVSEG